MSTVSACVNDPGRVAALRHLFLLDSPPTRSFDRLTQITSTHIGDGRVGKWRDALTPPQQAFAAMVLRPFVAAFGAVG